MTDTNSTSQIHRQAASFRTIVLISSGIGLLATAAAHADCDDLSYRRNLIYKNAGYCFKTQAQINNFGNAGCQFDDQADVPLSAHQRAEIAEIVRQERAFGCR